jgi:hypothetical protein
LEETILFHGKERGYIIPETIEKLGRSLDFGYRA